MYTIVGIPAIFALQGTLSFALSASRHRFWGASDEGIPSFCLMLFLTFSYPFIIGILIREYWAVAREDVERRLRHPAQYSMWRDPVSKHWYFYEIKTGFTTWNMPPGFEFYEDAPGLPWVDMNGLGPLIGQMKCGDDESELAVYWPVLHAVLILALSTLVFFFLPNPTPSDIPQFVFVVLCGFQALFFFKAWPLVDRSTSGRDVLCYATSAHLVCLLWSWVCFCFGSDALAVSFQSDRDPHASPHPVVSRVTSALDRLSPIRWRAL